MKRLALFLAVAVTLFPVGGARAATTRTQACPIVNGIDPDFVTFQGPGTIAGDGANHVVTLFASESEAARNPVTLIAIAHALRNGKPAAAVPIVGAANGRHDAVVSLSLTGTPGVVYAITWVASFDFGPHLCASFFPGHSAFYVSVS